MSSSGNVLGDIGTVCQASIQPPRFVRACEDASGVRRGAEAAPGAPGTPGLDRSQCMTERMCMTATAPEADAPSSGPTVLWQARVPRPLAHDIEQDMQVLGLSSQSEAIREALRLLHGRAREVAMARDYDEFYGGAAAPLPDLVAELHSQE